MSVVGDFRIPAGSFALEHALSADPEMRIEADRERRVDVVTSETAPTNPTTPSIGTGSPSAQKRRVQGRVRVSNRPRSRVSYRRAGATGRT